MSALLLMLAGCVIFWPAPLPLALRVGYVLACLALAGLMQWSPDATGWRMAGQRLDCSASGLWACVVAAARPLAAYCPAGLSGLTGGMTLGLCGRLSLLVYSIFLGEQGLQWRQLSDVLGLMVAMIGGISMAMSFGC